MLQYRKRYELLQRDSEGNTLPDSNSYNTASGMNCCNVFVKAVFRNVWFCYNTASGMNCCNGIRSVSCSTSTVTIPQAVWTVATGDGNIVEEIVDLQFVTIPQAVWTVATLWRLPERMPLLKLQYRKRYELLQPIHNFGWTECGFVTIPQAVWTVATWWVHWGLWRHNS